MTEPNDPPVGPPSDIDPYARIRQKIYALRELGENRKDETYLAFAMANDIDDALREIESIVSLDALTVLAEWQKLPTATRVLIAQMQVADLNAREKDMASQEEWSARGGLRTRELVNRRGAEAYHLLGMLAFTWAKEAELDMDPAYREHFSMPERDARIEAERKHAAETPKRGTYMWRMEVDENIKVESGVPDPAPDPAPEKP